MSDDEEEIAVTVPATRAVWDAVRRGAVSVGRSFAAAYRSVDPDVWRHAAQLPLAGLSLLVPRPSVTEALPDDGFRPLIFVHGLGGHPGNFIGLKTYFAGRGRTRSYVVDFGNASSFELMAAVVREVIDDVFARNSLASDAKVDIVSHSMGGLVTRLALDDEACRSRVASVVTLGTPHDGSHLARLGGTKLTVELRPGSETMRKLQTQDFWARDDSPALTAFWSHADTIVLPAESAHFPDGRTREVDGVTHYGYLIRPSVWREVWQALLA